MQFKQVIRSTLMNTLILCCLLAISAPSLYALSIDDHEMFVHPFLAHMGLPERQNEVNLRITSIQIRDNGEVKGDLAVHIEAGLVDKLGLHIRSDGVQSEDFSEIMLQYAVLADRTLSNGVSIFGQINFPTGPTTKDEVQGLIGISARLTAPDILTWDGNVHYNMQEAMIELESSFVFRLNNRYYTVLETRGHLNDERELYILPAMIFRIDQGQSFGVGLQVPVTDQREYDSQALFQYSVVFD